jgi:hypothetical protein
MKRRLLSAIALVTAVVGLPGWAPAHEFSANGVTVTHPWARATPGGATVGAAYLEIKTDTKTADRLIGAKSPVAGRVEIHTHLHEDGVMKMRQIPAIALKPGAAHLLKPSGDHVMLMDLKQPLKEGDVVKITLVFEKAGEIAIDATVEPIGAQGPHGMDHQPGHDAMDHGKHGAPPTAPASGHKH